MNNWNISVLNLGYLMWDKGWSTDGCDVNLQIKIPFLAFLLQKGSKKILVDCGIHEKYIKDGRGFAGLKAEGGSSYVLRALDDLNVRPKEIEMVIYTHLHNDHVGGCHLFNESLHIFQEDEWGSLCAPNPRDWFVKGYDFDIIPFFRQLQCILLEGDLEIEPGLKLYKTPGHSPGGQCIAVETAKGTYVMTGDTAFFKCTLYPRMDKMVLMDGAEIAITPYPDPYAPAIPFGRAGLLKDYNAWYRSIYRLKLLVKGPEFVLAGHEPSLINKVFG